MSRRSSDVGISSFRSRRSSFAGRSLTEYPSLKEGTEGTFLTAVIGDDPSSSSQQQPGSLSSFNFNNQSHNNNSSQEEDEQELSPEEEEKRRKKKEKEEQDRVLTEEEYNQLSAKSAFESIMHDYHNSIGAHGGKDLGLDDLHQYLAQFGLMSREALKDDLRLSSSPPPDLASPLNSPVAASNRSQASSAASAAAASQRSQSPTATCSVVKNEFVDFLCKTDHNMQSLRRSSRQWIENMVERQQAQLAHQARRRQQLLEKQQQQQYEGIGGSGLTQNTSVSFLETSGGGMQLQNTNNTNNNESSSSAAAAAAAAITLVDDDDMSGGLHGLDDASNDGEGNGNDHMSPAETLAAIEAKLRATLEARANTPVPVCLRIAGEEYDERGCVIPRGRQRIGSTTQNTPSSHGRRANAGTMNSMYVPASRHRPSSRALPPPGSPSSSQRNRGGGASSSSGATSPDASSSQQHSSPSSPSAVLRRHQQAQLEALLAVRRSGGKMLQQRSGSKRAQLGGTTIGGMTVVKQR